MKHCTCIMITIALLGALTANAQNWTFVRNGVSSAMLTNAAGWKFEMEEVDWRWTITKCVGAPASPGLLNLAAPVYDEDGFGTNITRIEGSNVIGGVLGAYRDKATGLALPDTLLYIGGGGFYGCDSLTGILEIPDSVVEFGYGTFKGTGFETIVMPSTDVFSDDETFANIASLKAVHFTGGYPRFGTQVFDGADNVIFYIRAENEPAWNPHVSGGPVSGGNAIWWDRPIRIGFYGWHLDASTSPAAITNLFGWRFSVTVSGSDLTLTDCVAAPDFPRLLPLHEPVSGGYQIVNITSPTRIGGILGTHANLATRLTLPGTLLNIGSYAFYSCPSLWGALIIPNAVTNIGNFAFDSCAGFDQLSIGRSVTAIGDGAFMDCTGFNYQLYIPDSVTRIGAFAFRSCAGFHNTLVLGNSVQTLGNYAFYHCTGFSGTLIIPDSVTAIGNGAFNDTRIQQIFTPSDGGTFGQMVFANNPALVAVHYAGGYPASVGADIYTGSSGVTSYVTAANAADWQSKFGTDGGTGIITNGNAMWLGRPLRTFDYDWHYVATPSPAITNALGWNIQVSVASPSPLERELTLTNCAAAPAFLSPLPLANPIQGGSFGTSSIVNIEGHNDGDFFGNYNYRWQVNSLTLPDTLMGIGDNSFAFCYYLTGTLTIPNSVTWIGDHAFESCYNLTGTLTIPDSVEGIGHWAFRDCSGFEGLSLGRSVVGIGERAFYGCSGLTGTLTIPDFVEDIGDYAFQSTHLQEIFTPSSDVRFREGVFSDNPSLTAVHYLGWFPDMAEWDIYEGSFNVVSYVGAEYAADWEATGEIVNGPISGGNATWRDRPIRIGPYDWHLDTSTSPAAITNFFGWRFAATVSGNDLTLTNCLAAPAQPCPLNFAYPVSGGYQIVNITSPTRIGGILGSYSNQATRLTLPGTLLNIGNYAFYFCPSLCGALFIPNAVTNIGYYAFQSCAGFDQLSIGHSVAAIGDGAFMDCTFFYDTLIIPDSVTRIGARAFQNCACDTLVLGSSVQTIGNYAFQDCAGFTGTLIIPDSVTSIGIAAFNNTHIQQIFTPSDGVAIGGGAFGGISSLLAVHYSGGYPASVGVNLYNGSSSVTSYVTAGNAADWQSKFGGTGTITDGNAIWRNQPLRTFDYDWHYVAIPSPAITNALGWNIQVSVYSLPFPLRNELTLTNCAAAPAFPSPLPLANPIQGGFGIYYSIVDIEGQNGGWASSSLLGDYRGLVGSLTLPGTLKGIGDHSFDSCYNLTGPLAIPNSVTWIGDYSFYSCHNLTGTLTISDSVEDIGDSAFDGCEGLEGLSLGNSVRVIWNSAFHGCYGLTGTLTIPDSVGMIWDYAFSSCSGLEGLSLGHSVYFIGDDAFYGCSGLTGTLTIPDSVGSIEGEAFRGTRFTQIFTPSTGVEFGGGVFSYNPSLTAVYYTGTYPFSTGIGFNGLYEQSPNVTSYVTTGNVANWQLNFGADGGTGSIAGGTAIWQGQPIRTYAQNITVSFDGNGAWNGPFSDKTVQVSLTYGVLPDPQRTGHNTPVWTLGGEPVTSATTVTTTTNHTLTAQWTANTYTVVFNAGSGGNASPYSQAFTYGTPAELMPNTFTRDGFTFVGWMYYGNFNTTTFYMDGATVLNLTPLQNGTVSLFAQWVPNGLLGEGVTVTQISVSPKGEVTLHWAPEKAYYIVYATDDLARPVAQWTPFTRDHPFHPILTISGDGYGGAELSRDSLDAARLDPDHLFFHVRMIATEE